MGNPKEEKASDLFYYAVIVFIVVGIGFIIWTEAYAPPPPLHPPKMQSERNKVSWKNQDNSTMAYFMLHEYVKKSLKSPTTAKFPEFRTSSDNWTKKIEDHKYKTISYVDSQNTFGAMMRTLYYGTIQQVDEDHWLLVSLDFE